MNVQVKILEYLRTLKTSFHVNEYTLFSETGHFHGSEETHYDLIVTISEQVGSESSDFYLADDEFKSSWDKDNLTEPSL
jgi:hypothetical protein